MRIYLDPNQPRPEGLTDVFYPEDGVHDPSEYADTESEIDYQEDTYDDDDSELEEDEVGDELDVPGSFEIVSQTVKTGPDGSQVVDVVIEVEEVPGAVKYEVRLSRA